jgi:hypothetical protein
MATQSRKAQTERPPLKPRPRPDADALKGADAFMERFPKTLEYLGR